MTSSPGRQFLRAGAIAATSILVFPETALAQSIPPIFLVLVSIPIVTISLAAVNAVIRWNKSGACHLLVACSWAPVFVVVSDVSTSDIAAWAPVVGCGIHGVVLSILLSIHILGQRRNVRRSDSHEAPVHERTGNHGEP